MAAQEFLKTESNMKVSIGKPWEKDDGVPHIGGAKRSYGQFIALLALWGPLVMKL